MKRFFVGVLVLGLLSQAVVVMAVENVDPRRGTETSCDVFKVGDLIVISSSGTNVRSAAGTNNAVVSSRQSGETGKITQGPIKANTYCWFKVDFDSGVDGWVASINLRLKTNSGTSPSVGSETPSVSNVSGCTRLENGNPIRSLEAVRLRRDPSIPPVAPGSPFSSNLLNVIQTIPAGTRGWVEAGPQFSNNYCWWKIKTVTNVVGWAVGNYFEKVTTEVVDQGPDASRGLFKVLSPSMGSKWVSINPIRVTWEAPVLPSDFQLNERVIELTTGDAIFKTIKLTSSQNWYDFKDFSGVPAGKYRFRVAYKQLTNFLEKIPGKQIWGESGTFELALQVETPDLPPPVINPTCGDVNQDGRVDISDAGSILNYIFSGTPLISGIAMADVDGSGTVTLSDAIVISNFISGNNQLNCSGTPNIPSVNQAPTISLIPGGNDILNTNLSSITIPKETRASYRFRLQDPENKPIICWVNWGDGTASDCTTNDMSGGGGVAAGMHTYVNPGTYQFSVIATDDKRAATTRSLQVVVRDSITPSVTSTLPGTPTTTPPVISGPLKVEPVVNPEFTVKVNLGTSASEVTLGNYSDRVGFRYNVLSGTFPVQYRYDWGNGVVKTGTINSSYPSIGDFYQYTKSGVFTFSITLTDSAGGIFTKSVKISAFGDWASSAPCGDINGDLVVNETDATMIKDYVSGAYVPPQSVWKLDTDGSGTVTISDSIYLINYLKLGGPAPKCLRPSNIIADESLNSPNRVVVNKTNNFWRFVPMAYAALPVTFTLNWGDGTPNSVTVVSDGTLKQVMHVFTKTGKFIVTLTAVDAQGTRATKTLEVEVVSDSNALLPTKPSAIGDRVKVNTAPYNYSLAVFEFSSMYGNTKFKPSGSLGIIAEGPNTNNAPGIRTWKVLWDDGVTGWSYETGLEKVN